MTLWENVEERILASVRLEFQGTTSWPVQDNVTVACNSQDSTEGGCGGIAHAHNNMRLPCVRALEYFKIQYAWKLKTG
jgi:hypothetical protein